MVRSRTLQSAVCGLAVVASAFAAWPARADNRNACQSSRALNDPGDDNDGDDDRDDRHGHWSTPWRLPELRIKPRDFVGAANDCFPGSPAGAAFVTTTWLPGIGLPDNGHSNSNPADPRDNPAKRDRHSGLLFSKNGPTPDCSAAGATVHGLGRKPFTLNELGYDYRNGSHCGAGSPRFNAITPEGFIYFIGCAHGTKTPAPQDPTEWTRVRFNTASVYPQYVTNPPFQFGVTKVARLVIVADEGTDTPSVEQPLGVGLIVIDNVVVNGNIATGP